MRKWITWLWVGVMLDMLTACSACGGAEEPLTSDGGTAVAGRKIGMGSVNKVSMEGTQRANIKVTVAALVLDTDGKIADCRLDELAFSVGLTNGLPESVENFTTKWELGDNVTLV